MVVHTNSTNPTNPITGALKPSVSCSFASLGLRSRSLACHHPFSLPLPRRLWIFITFGARRLQTLLFFLYRSRPLCLPPRSPFLTYPRPTPPTTSSIPLPSTTVSTLHRRRIPATTLFVFGFTLDAAFTILRRWLYTSPTLASLRQRTSITRPFGCGFFPPLSTRTIFGCSLGRPAFHQFFFFSHFTLCALGYWLWLAFWVLLAVYHNCSL